MFHLCSTLTISKWHPNSLSCYVNFIRMWTVMESCKNGFYISLTFVSLLLRTYIYVIKSSGNLDRCSMLTVSRWHPNLLSSYVNFICELWWTTKMASILLWLQCHFCCCTYCLPLHYVDIKSGGEAVVCAITWQTSRLKYCYYRPIERNYKSAYNEYSTCYYNLI